MIEAIIPLVVSTLLLAALDTPSPPAFGTELQQLASEFTTGANQLLATVDGTVLDITRAAYITVLLLGLFLYFTHLSRRFGRDLITGGIALAVLSEFVFPVLVKA